MAEAREVMNRITEAVFSNDREALSQLYAEDAVAETPDEGTVSGRDGIMDWELEFLKAFPDASWESTLEHESGNIAVDEGFFVGTNTGPLEMPDGEVPPTGKSVRVRACDIATVENGLITSHRFYFDQMEFMTQLGLVPEEEQAAAG
jgi:predicted ester cyclase